MTGRAAGARLRAGAALAVPAVLAGLGLPVLAAAVIAAGVACWVLASAERTDRLARLIAATRGGPGQPTAALSPRPAGTASCPPDEADGPPAAS